MTFTSLSILRMWPIGVHSEPLADPYPSTYPALICISPVEGSIMYELISMETTHKALSLYLVGFECINYCLCVRCTIQVIHKF